jgi:hypothetical protein
MKIFSDNGSQEIQNTHFIFNNFFFSENRAVYETMWSNIVEPVRPQMKIYGARALNAG